MAKEKNEVANNEEGQSDFHAKYRPGTFDTLIGHEDTVTRLRGTIATGKLPSALMFAGPSSAGKTTLARAFAAEVNGKPVSQQTRDYKEINAASERSIEDMRQLIGISHMKPVGKRRIIVIDEAQALVSNPAAAAAILKPLEEPSKQTIWILCTMDPTKFTTGNGKAMANRCKQFVLNQHDDKDLLKQAVRIAKGEGMKYVMDEEKTLLKEVVRNSQSEMRTLANLMENLYDFYHGLKDKPKKLGIEHVQQVLRSSMSNDDELARRVLIGLYSGKFKQVQRAILDIQEGFQFLTKLLWANSFLLNNAVIEGGRHRKVWWNLQNKTLVSDMKKAKVEASLGMLAAVNAMLVEVKGIAASFQTTPEELLSAHAYRLIKEQSAAGAYK